MTDHKRVHEGKVLPPAVDRVSAADALGAFNQIVGFLREAIQIHETESTKREKLKTYRETEIARIKASEKALRYYLDRTYEERHETHRRLFESLDVAVAAGDVPAMQAVLGGIVEVARTSPLADIGNIGELQRAMADPRTTFEF
jgi:hypothetical protein